MYSPAACPPCHAKITPVKATPIEIHTADSMAASLVEGTCGRRWTSSRSPTSRTDTKARKATHAQIGTEKLAKFSDDSDVSVTRAASVIVGNLRRQASWTAFPPYRGPGGDPAITWWRPWPL